MGQLIKLEPLIGILGPKDSFEKYYLISIYMYLGIYTWGRNMLFVCVCVCVYIYIRYCFSKNNLMGLIYPQGMLAKWFGPLVNVTLNPNSVYIHVVKRVGKTNLNHLENGEN